MNLVVRTTQDPATLERPIRRLVAEMDPSLAISQVRTMRQVYDGSLGTRRFFMTLLITFAVVGLVLALVGVYGVIAQMASGRTREMGIRMALGARATEVQWLVVRYGLRLVGVGLVVGALAAAASTRVMRKLLFEVAPTDPVTFGAVGALLAVAAVAATWLPAARASRTDPARTLREE
jgi:putative ABC transport system permease protein